MNTETKLQKAGEAARNAAKIKTLNLKLAVTDRDLRHEIKSVFDLAKSAGQELDLTFSCQSF